MFRKFEKNFTTQVPEINKWNMEVILFNQYAISSAKTTKLKGNDDFNFQLDEINFTNSRSTVRKQLIKICKSLTTFKSIVKFTNPIEALVPNLINAQIELMEVLKRKNIPVAEILDTVNGSKFDLVTLKYFDVKNDDLQEILTPLRMFSILSGDTLEKFCRKYPEITRMDMNVAIAHLLGNFHNATDFFQNLDNPTVTAFKFYSPIQSAKSWPLIEREFEYLRRVKLLKDKSRMDLSESVLIEFTEKVLNIKSSLEHGIIHSDLNDTNIFWVKSNNGLIPQVSGLIDFGDSHWSARIFDISNTLLYLFSDIISRSEDPNKYKPEFIETNLNELVKYFLCEYLKVRKGSRLVCETRHIGISIKARILSSIYYQYHLCRINYRDCCEWSDLLNNIEPEWKLLEALCNANIDSIFEDSDSD